MVVFVLHPSAHISVLCAEAWYKFRHTQIFLMVITAVRLEMG
jgi:hypothetical protein